MDDEELTRMPISEDRCHMADITKVKVWVGFCSACFVLECRLQKQDRSGTDLDIRLFQSGTGSA